MSAIGGKTNIQHYEKGYRFDLNGWTYVHIEGEPFERGVQYGVLARDKFQQIVDKTKYMTLQTLGMPYEFFVEQAVRLTQGKIPEELMQEMAGFAAGLTKAGYPAAVEDIIGWNAYAGVTGYWWPSVGHPEYLKAKGHPHWDSVPRPKVRQGHCSAFVATGDATPDGRIVIGHESWDDFWTIGMLNVMLDLQPTEGARIFMQTAPGYVFSNSDFFICKSEKEDSLMVGLETTMLGPTVYDVGGVPEWVRVRTAMQYGYNINQWIACMQEGNNGSNPGLWLLGDIRSNEIARFEQGYIFQGIEKKSDGYFFGCNAVEDPRIRNVECVGVGYNDTRRQTGGRRTRWPQLLEPRAEKSAIDLEQGKVMLADVWDLYHQRERGGANTICGMYDLDPRENFSSSYGVWPDPFTPAGSLDAKITNAEMAERMEMTAIIGRANGVAFDADEFLRRYPQWAWQRPALESNPSQPWTLFRAGEPRED